MSDRPAPSSPGTGGRRSPKGAAWGTMGADGRTQGWDPDATEPAPPGVGIGHMTTTRRGRLALIVAGIVLLAGGLTLIALADAAGDDDTGAPPSTTTSRPSGAPTSTGPLGDGGGDSNETALALIGLVSAALGLCSSMVGLLSAIHSRTVVVQAPGGSDASTPPSPPPGTPSPRARPPAQTEEEP